MFTGLVETMGTLVRQERRGPGARLTIRCALAPLVLGESIACDGVCLTVDAIEGDRFLADASAETLARTTLGGLQIGHDIHLERALAVGQRFGGHIVSGHVDGVGELTEVTPVGEALDLRVRLPEDLMRYVAVKGSVTLSGISLTVNSLLNDTISLVVVPRTQRSTKLATPRIGDKLNVEVDVLARYLERLMQRPSLAGSAEAPEGGDAAWMSRLGKSGYL